MSISFSNFGEYSTHVSEDEMFVKGKGDKVSLKSLEKTKKIKGKVAKSLTPEKLNPFKEFRKSKRFEKPKKVEKPKFHKTPKNKIKKDLYIL